MATKKQATAKPNRIWLEVERPCELPRGQVNEDGGSTDTAHAAVICTRFNNVLQRLMPGTSFKLWWNQYRAMYSLTTSEAGTYTDLGDNGHWFNLDHLGRDIGTKE